MPVACLKCKTVTGFSLYIFSKVFICVHPQYIWSLSPLHVWILLFSIKIICSWHNKNEELVSLSRTARGNRPTTPLSACTLLPVDKNIILPIWEGICKLSKQFHQEFVLSVCKKMLLSLMRNTISRVVLLLQIHLLSSPTVLTKVCL